MSEDSPPTAPASALDPADETALYRSSMVGRFTWLLERFFAFTFTRIKPDLEHLPAVRKAATNGLIVYVMRNRSVLDYVFFNWYFARYGLPLARFGNGVNTLWFGTVAEVVRKSWHKLRDRWNNGPMPDPIDAGFMIRTVAAGQPVLLFLRRQPSWVFRRPQQSREDMIEQLLRLQESEERPIFVVPQIIVWERRPEYTQRNLVDLLFGERDHPGRLRKLLHFLIYHRGAVVRMGEPVDLRAFADALPGQPLTKRAKKLRLLLRGYLYREKRLIKGPTVKPRAWLLDRIRHSPRVEKAIERVAQRDRRSVGSLERRVDKMLDQTAADFSFNWILFARILFDFVLNRIYAGVEFRSNDAERIRRAGRRGTLVFVPCHRSHLDYILISWCVFHQQLQPPHVAAGANLSFWPLGPVLRRWGAFFLRRSFRDDALYHAVFSTYVRELVREGVPQEFFIEGTRSRTGGLLPPKVGLLSMYLAAAADGVAPDVMFVPISLSYEKVVEETEYHKELTGGEKQKEDLRGLAATSQVLSRRYGRVYVRVGEPLSARGMLDQAPAPMPKLDAEERKAFLKRSGEQILWEIHRVTPVTPSAVAAVILLCHDRRGMQVREFARRSRFLMRFLADRGAVFSNSLTSEPADALDEALRRFADNKLVQMFAEDDGDDIIAIVPERRMTLDYYKNNISNHLAGAAMAAVAGGPSGRPRGEVAERFGRLADLLAIDIRFDPDADPDASFDAAIAELTAAGVLADEDGKVVVASERRAALFRALLTNVLESYLIAVRGVGVLASEALTEKKLLDQLLKEGRKRYMIEDVTRFEAISKAVLRNAVRRYRELGVLRRRADGDELMLDPERHAHHRSELYELMERT